MLFTVYLELKSVLLHTCKVLLHVQCSTCSTFKGVRKGSYSCTCIDNVQAVTGTCTYYTVNVSKMVQIYEVVRVQLTGNEHVA